MSEHVNLSQEIRARLLDLIKTEQAASGKFSVWLDAAELAKQYPVWIRRANCLDKMPPGQYDIDEPGYEEPDPTDDYEPRPKIGRGEFESRWAGRPYFTSRDAAINKMVHWIETERQDIVYFVKNNAYAYMMEQRQYDRIQKQRTEAA